jgi:hypothetical protein
VPIDNNNAAENAMRPLAVGRKNRQFVDSQQTGERAAVVLSLIKSLKLIGHDPWAHLKDVCERLPKLKHRDLARLLPDAQRRRGCTNIRADRHRQRTPSARPGADPGHPKVVRSPNPESIASR